MFLSQHRTCLFVRLQCRVMSVFNELRWEVVGRFCFYCWNCWPPLLNFLFITTKSKRDRLHTSGYKLVLVLVIIKTTSVSAYIINKPSNSYCRKNVHFNIVFKYMYTSLPNNDCYVCMIDLTVSILGQCPCCDSL